MSQKTDEPSKNETKIKSIHKIEPKLDKNNGAFMGLQMKLYKIIESNLYDTAENRKSYVKRAYQILGNTFKKRGGSTSKESQNNYILRLRKHYLSQSISKIKPWNINIPVIKASSRYKIIRKDAINHTTFSISNNKCRRYEENTKIPNQYKHAMFKQNINHNIKSISSVAQRKKTFPTLIKTKNLNVQKRQGDLTKIGSMKKQTFSKLSSKNYFFTCLKTSKKEEIKIPDCLRKKKEEKSSGSLETIGLENKNEEKIPPVFKMDGFENNKGVKIADSLKKIEDLENKNEEKIADCLKNIEDLENKNGEKISDSLRYRVIYENKEDEKITQCFKKIDGLENLITRNEELYSSINEILSRINNIYNSINPHNLQGENIILDHDTTVKLSFDIIGDSGLTISELESHQDNKYMDSGDESSNEIQNHDINQNINNISDSNSSLDEDSIVKSQTENILQDEQKSIEVGKKHAKFASKVMFFNEEFVEHIPLPTINHEFYTKRPEVIGLKRFMNNNPHFSNQNYPTTEIYLSKSNEIYIENYEKLDDELKDKQSTENLNLIPDKSN